MTILAERIFTSVNEQSKAVLGSSVVSPFISGSKKEAKEASMSTITPSSLRDFRDQINNLAEAMQIRYVLVSRDAVNSGEAAFARSFGESQPAVIAAKFPDGYGFDDLAAFRQGLSDLIGQDAPVVSFDSLPRAILEFRVKL